MLELESLESRTKPLGARRGTPPRTSPALPHEQLSQNGPAALREELLERALTLPGVVGGTDRTSTPGTESFLLEPGYAGGPRAAFLTGNEFAHLHPGHDGSLHLTLPWGLSDEVVARGWGEVQVDVGAPSRGGSPIPLMLYAPRDEDELETVWRVFEMSYEFARGEG